MSDEREQVADELRRIREQIRNRATGAPEAAPEAGLEPRQPRPPDPGASPQRGPAPESPDATALNALWDVRLALPRAGWKGVLARALVRLIGPTLDAQVTFNSRQVQLDNALLEYLDRRFAHTHEHYDDVLGVHGRHLQDIDERHLILQEELVAHVHDLVKRIDLVLSRAERGGSSLRHELRDLSARIARLDQRLGGA
jgi:hypothetical protein